jgi:energy-coupling factor transport system ATP-binding protein
VIKVQNLNYIYQRGTPFESQALFDINIQIPDGSLTAIIGHTGSGKSTLIQHFNALIRPTSGKIIINDIDITAKEADLKKIRCMVGLVFQYPEHQLFEETVYKDIAFGPKNMGMSEKEIDNRVKSAMSMVGLDEKYAYRSPFELSGGEKRRAAIAGVLAMSPKVLILDEPAAGLDPAGREGILSTIKELHKKNPGMIIIFISHSMEDVAKTAQNVIVMNKGRIAMSGSVPEIFSRSDELIKMGLNVPQITQLSEKLRILGYPLDKDIYTVKSAAESLKRLLGGANNA